MPTSAGSLTDQVKATHVRFVDDTLYILLSDGRGLNVPLDRIEWLRWLLNATPEQRAKWSLEPGGFAVYWEELDDGIEVCRLLDMQPLV